MAQNFHKYEFNYSRKNIPIPSKKEYIMQLTHSTEKFIANLRWRSHFHLNPHLKSDKKTYGFNSIKAAPNVKELKQLEDRLYTMIKNIEFRPSSSDFQNKLRNDINNINNNEKLIVAADKTLNYYQVEAKDYCELLKKNIETSYEIAADGDTLTRILRIRSK